MKRKMREKILMQNSNAPDTGVQKLKIIQNKNNTRD
jgi:hypothetical protein